MIEGPLRPSRTSSHRLRLLVVRPANDGVANDYISQNDGRIDRRRAAAIGRPDGCDAGRGAIIVAGIARRRGRAIVAAGSAHTSISLPSGRTGGKPPSSGRARTIERRYTGGRREHGCGDRDRPRPRLRRDPQRHRHEDRHAAARDAAIDQRGHRRPHHRPGRDHRSGGVALCPRRVRRRLRRGLAPAAPR